MSLLHPHRLRLFAAMLAAFAATAAVLVALHHSPSASTPDLRTLGGTGIVPVPGLSTDERIRNLQSVARAQPKDADVYAYLGDAYLQKARETGDAGFYNRADGVLRRALELSPQNVSALTEMGALSLSRHDFRGGLRYARQVNALAPQIVKPYGVLVDALVELGRYDEAGAALQRMVDLKPNLSSYARVSYFRELHGDLPGAVRAMRLAVSSGGDAPENIAYVQTLLGNLELDLGRVASAQRAYRLALARFAGYVPAEVGLARVEAQRGRFGAAIARYRAAVARLPLPEYVIGLGETELAAGRTAAARRDLALVGAEQQLLKSAGVNTDVDLALFEANHGSTQRAIVLGRRAWASAPSVRSADALGWALTRAGRAREGLGWATRALRLGSRDPSFLYHAGVAAKDAGRRDLAARYLRGALALNPRFSPVYGPRAERALAGLS
jgi:tetratricopeptide (TPR) repeat protein